VRTKASSQEECLQEVEELLKTRYHGQSGIIYATSIKDCEQLMLGLRDRKLRVGCYHANLEATLRSKVHAKWLSGEYQVGLLFHISFISFNQSLQVNGPSDIEHVTVGVFTVISQGKTVIMHKYQGCR
jgi:hypothetical protein